jgi:aryl-alcohol dehydrogenase-like predicted oxidoreductase
VDVYGDGLSERRIGQYLKECGSDVTVATKVGRHPSLYPDGYHRKERVRASIEGSARRLGVETLDLVQLHCVPHAVMMAGDILAWMEDFQSAGLFRAFGASVETIEEALFAAGHPGIVSLQVIFNLFRQNAISELFPVAEANEVGIIVRLPLASGVLGGKMTSSQQFDTSDHRHYNRHGEAFSVGETFSGVPFEKALGFVERIRQWLPEGMSMAQLAMRWILDQPAVTTVIAGASRPGQVHENASASGLDPLPADLHRRLADLYFNEIEHELLVPV